MGFYAVFRGNSDHTHKTTGNLYTIRVCVCVKKGCNSSKTGNWLRSDNVRWVLIGRMLQSNLGAVVVAVLDEGTFYIHVASESEETFIILCVWSVNFRFLGL